MKKFILLLTVLCLVSCGNESNNTDDTELNTSQAKSKTQKNTQKKASTEIPNLADYQGQCPKNWGLVEGATRTHVDKFIQNFIFVPENPGPMYSDIQEFPYTGGSILLKAATYKMQDNIVDQEMLTIFVGEKMTQCNVRFRCAADVNKWVNTCDRQR